MITDEQIAEWERHRGHGMTSAVGEYTPSEFWKIIDELKRLRHRPPDTITITIPRPNTINSDSNMVEQQVIYLLYDNYQDAQQAEAAILEAMND